MLSIIIRDAVPSDAEEICRMHVDSVRRLDGPYYSAEQIEAWAGPKRPEHYVETMANTEKKLFVAVADGRVVGFAGILGPELRGMYVSPDHVGRGAGRGLWRRVEAWCLSQGVPAVHLMSSLQAVPFYLKMGFRKIEEVKIRLSGGVPLEAVRMEKYLGRP